MTSYYNRYMTVQLRRFILIGLVSAGLGTLFFSYLHYSEKGNFPILSQNVFGLLLSMALACVAGFAAYYLNSLLDKVLPWKSGFAVRFTLGYVAQVASASLILFGISSAL